MCEGKIWLVERVFTHIGEKEVNPVLKPVIGVYLKKDRKKRRG